jgi:hypothetical protein
MVFINVIALSLGIIALAVGFLSNGELIIYTDDDFLISGMWLIRYAVIYGIFWAVSFIVTGFVFNV